MTRVVTLRFREIRKERNKSKKKKIYDDDKGISRGNKVTNFFFFLLSWIRTAEAKEKKAKDSVWRVMTG
jgi:hypothetical protein